MRNALTAPQYVYCILFSNRDLPKLRQSHWLPEFPPQRARNLDQAAPIPRPAFGDLAGGTMGEARSPKVPAVLPLVRGNPGADDARAGDQSQIQRRAAGAVQREL